MSKLSQQAKSLFLNKYNCSQTTLGVFAEQFALPFNMATNLAAGLGAGLGYQGKTCGAVAGAYMVFGLISAKQFDENEMVKENTFQLMQKFNKAFIEKFGALDCKNILGVDIGTQEGMAKGQELELFTKKCPLLVEEAVVFIENELEKNK